MRDKPGRGSSRSQRHGDGEGDGPRSTDGEVWVVDS